MGAQDFLLKMGEVDLYGRGALSIEGCGKGIGGGGGNSNNVLYPARLSLKTFIFVFTNFEKNIFLVQKNIQEVPVEMSWKPSAHYVIWIFIFRKDFKRAVFLFLQS